jgi:hypothetical protein
MKKPVHPTAEAIEAALSAYDCRYEEQPENGTQFIEIMSSNDRLKAEIHGAADLISEIDLPELEGEFTPEVVRLYKVNMLCNMFFWVGWNSRGAIEEAEQLKRMAEYTGS